MNSKLPLALLVLSWAVQGLWLETRLVPVITAPKGVRGVSVPIRVVFEEDGFATPVKGFSATDVSLTNGRLSDFRDLGGAYEFKVAPTASEFTVSIAEAAVDNRFAIFTQKDAGTPFYTWKHSMEISFPGYETGRETLEDLPRPAPDRPPRPRHL